MFLNTVRNFISYVVISTIIVGTVLVLKALLYKNEVTPYVFTIETKEIDKKFYTKISEGSEVIDSITKRRVGEVIYAVDHFSGDVFYLEIAIGGGLPEKRHALFCDGLWFEYEVVKNETFGL